MNYKIIPPPPILADYVRFLWFLEMDASTDKRFVHHAFAHHCPEITFCYKGQFKYKSGFEGEKNLISGIYGQTQIFSRVICAYSDLAFFNRASKKSETSFNRWWLSAASIIFSSNTSPSLPQRVLISTAWLVSSFAGKQNNCARA